MSLPTHLTLVLVTPDHAVAQAEVDEVQLPGEQGYFGVLPGHAPMLASLSVGPMWYRRGQERTDLAVAFGIAEILPDRVIVMARVAERAEEIDVARAEAAMKRAEDNLAHLKSERDVEIARLSMLKQMVRLRVATRGRTRG
ncbi:MAG: F0F1 ATP synthase subunit epsilon [Acidobacteria bacterium]|nr:F0F1 ATP synthase subunit epsilon [Acidobacteriota bacterium]